MIGTNVIREVRRRVDEDIVTEEWRSALDYISNNIGIVTNTKDVTLKANETRTISGYVRKQKNVETAVTEKLEDEKFIGTISGEIVTVAIHDFCKVNLGLSDSNIELFKKALEGGYLGNVGPQVSNGTEFSSNRWDDYIDCVGSKRI